MNNNITEDYVSFQVAKLLKEKGFRVCWPYVSQPSFYKEELTWTTPNYEFPDEEEKYLRMDRIFCPTISIVIKWLRENFNIHIKYEPTINNRYEVFVYKTGWEYVDTDESIEEIIDSALLYTLKNLI